MRVASPTSISFLIIPHLTKIISAGDINSLNWFVSSYARGGLFN